MKRKEYLICLLIILALLPILIFRDFTPSNELRYLSIADEALRNNNYFAFTNHGLPYADKPPLYLWIVMFGKALFDSHQMWFLSLFSILPALGCSLLMNKWVKNAVHSEGRVAGIPMLMSCGMFAGAAIVVRMDMLMCLFIMLSLYTFYEMYSKGISFHGRNRFLFPVYIFLAVFTKGPLGFLIPFFSTITFLIIQKKWKLLPKIWGWHTWLILLVGCLVWFGMVYREGGNDYLQNLLVHQTMDRAINAFTHNKPFYYYLYSVWYCMMPWSLLAGGAIIVYYFKNKHEQNDLNRFFLSVIGCTFIILSLISSKIDIYLIPAYPFIIYLGIISLQHTNKTSWMTFTVVLPASLLTMAFPIICILVSMDKFSYLEQIPLYAAAAILTLTGIVSLYNLFHRYPLLKSVKLISAGLFIALFAGGWGVPTLNERLGYGALCNRSITIAAQHKLEDFCVWRLSRPENMDVYLHRDVEILPSDKPLPTDLENKILMLPQKEISKITNYKEIYQVGNNAIVVL